MTTPEVLRTLEAMTLIIDTREQETALLKKRLAQMDCPYERQKLDFGDYSAKFLLPDGGWFSLSEIVAVERKMSIDELAQCFTRGRKRFENEFCRARDKNAKLYLLVENATWEKVYSGSYRTKMDVNALSASILAWQARYVCPVVFCKPELSGKLIKGILYREAKEHLERMVE